MERAPSAPEAQPATRVAGLALRVALVTSIVAASALFSAGGAAAAGGPAGRGSTPTGSASKPGPVTIVAGGDTIFGNTPTLPAHPARYLRAVARPLAAADLTFVNLEGTLTTARRSKCSTGGAACFAFRNPPRYARYLRAVGVDVASMGNNHSHDFGALGLKQTARSLTTFGVRHTGLPGQITIIRRNGVRFAFLAFAPYPWTSPLLKLGRAASQIRSAVRLANVVVVYMHAGAEGAKADHVTGHEEHYLGEDRGNPERFAHMAVRNGADLVIASGPHVLRGMEFFHHHLIAYSLGNLCGYHNFNTAGVLSRSALLRVTLGSHGRFRAGRLVSLRLSSTNRPSVDRSGAGRLMIRRLGHADFGDRSPRIFADGHFVERA